MKLYKPKFWKKNKNFFTILLFPLSLIYICLIKLRKILISKKKFKIPIICVGNIYIGGTGKTPTSIYLAKQFLKDGLNPVIIRKYYSNHHDEYELIKNHFKNFIFNKKRSSALIEAENSMYDVAILDDGFQDYKIKKDLNIICFNSNQLIGNGLLVMLDEKTKIGNFFNKDEIILYKNVNDLSSKIIKYSNDNKLRCKIAKKGRDKYFKYFNSTIVADYIVNKTIGTKRRFFWENV